jgi:hypothetical protein
MKLLITLAALKVPHRLNLVLAQEGGFFPPAFPAGVVIVMIFLLLLEILASLLGAFVATSDLHPTCKRPRIQLVLLSGVAGWIAVFLVVAIAFSFADFIVLGIALIFTPIVGYVTGSITAGFLRRKYEHRG